jgi:hypothetical protein
MALLIVFFLYQNWERTYIKYIAGYTLCLALTAYTFSPHMRFMDVKDEIKLAKTEQKVTSSGQRLELWNNTWTLIKRYPVLGGGAGSFVHDYATYIPKDRIVTVLDYKNVHNQYLRVLQEFGFFRGADVGLRAGMQLDGWHVDLQQAHVLHDQGVNASVIHLPSQFAGGFELIVAQNGVQGDKNATVKAVRVLHQTGDVLHRIVCTRSGAKRGAADVHRIGAMKDGLHADLRGTSGRQEFKLVGKHGWRLSRKQKTRPKSR